MSDLLVLGCGSDGKPPDGQKFSVRIAGAHLAESLAGWLTLEALKR
jgi:hypothetical protein